MKVSYSVLLLSIFCITWHAQAQDPSWREGEIEDAEIVIEKDREIELPKAVRNFERVPSLPVQGPSPEVNYRFVELSPALSNLNPEIRVLKVKEPPLPQLYGNYIKAGAANYITPYLELFVNNTRSKDYTYGLYVNHLSSRNGPVDGANSGNSHSEIGLNGKYFAGKHTLSAEAGYQRERFHYYGYDPIMGIDGMLPTRDSIRQIFNIAHVQAELKKNAVEAPFQYSMGVSLDRIGDRFGAAENQLGLALNLGLNINEELSFRIASNSYFMQWNSVSETNTAGDISRQLVKFKPYLAYSAINNGKGLEAHAGFNIAYENDTILNGDRLHFYPYLWGTYHISEGLGIYAQIEGDMQKTSWLDFTRENPFLSSAVGLAHTNKTLGLTGGIKGRLSSIFGFNAGFSADNYKNMYYFVNSAADSTKFDILYDTGNTFLLNFFGEINLNTGKRFHAAFRTDFYNYSTDVVAAAWHKPDLKLSLLAHYNLYEKVLLSTELLVLTGIEGYNAASGSSRELAPLVDLGLKGDYIFSSRFSSFLQLKNILAQNYERYMNYPSRGFMVMLGATYSF